MKKFLLLLALGSLLSACQGGVDDFSEEEIVISAQGEGFEEYSDEYLEGASQFESTVYFAFDSSFLTPAAKDKLQRNAQWLAEENQANLTIEGHADARGSREYNLALGERRAYSVKRFLVSRGVNPSRINVVSYGEERPATVGANSNSYRLNRRAELIVN